MIYYAALAQTSEDNRLIFREKRIGVEKNGLYVWGIVDTSFRAIISQYFRRKSINRTVEILSSRIAAGH